MELEAVNQIIFSLSGVSIYTLNENNKTTLNNGLVIPNKVNEIIKSNRNQVLKQIHHDDVVRLKDMSNMSYIGFYVQECKVVIGPFLDQETDLNNLTAIKRRLRLIGEEAVMLDNMYNQLRVLDPTEIVFLYNAITRLTGFTLDPIQYRRLTPEKVKSAKTIDVDSLFKEFEFVARNYQVEEQFLKLVESGDVEQAHNFRTHEIMVKLPERAINDSLRNSKTRLTIFNTLCNRAAIRGGIDVQLGHQISTNFGIQIESMTSNFDTNKFFKDILVTYTEAVHNYAIKDYSKLIRNAILYIRRHITTNVGLQDIADYMFVSKEHLSRQFKMETKQTITQFINKAKVIEAKKLLEQKNQSIMDISIMLGFANSSHFSKVFKDHIGITPKQYQLSLH